MSTAFDERRFCWGCCAKALGGIALRQKSPKPGHAQCNRCENGTEKSGDVTASRNASLDFRTQWVRNRRRGGSDGCNDRCHDGTYAQDARESTPEVLWTTRLGITSPGPAMQTRAARKARLCTSASEGCEPPIRCGHFKETALKAVDQTFRTTKMHRINN